MQMTSLSSEINERKSRFRVGGLRTSLCCHDRKKYSGTLFKQKFSLKARPKCEWWQVFLVIFRHFLLSLPFATSKLSRRRCRCRGGALLSYGPRLAMSYWVLHREPCQSGHLYATSTHTAVSIRQPLRNRHPDPSIPCKAPSYPLGLENFFQLRSPSCLHPKVTVPLKLKHASWGSGLAFQWANCIVVLDRSV